MKASRSKLTLKAVAIRSRLHLRPVSETAAKAIVPILLIDANKPIKDKPYASLHNRIIEMVYAFGIMSSDIACFAVLDVNRFGLRRPYILAGDDSV